jgi:hypothetical protein
VRTSKIFFISLALTFLFIQSGNAFDWKEYNPQGSYCSIQMPKNPQLCVKKGVPTDSGPIDMYQVLADYGDYAFLLTFSDYPDALLKKKTSSQILDDVVSGSVGDGELVNKSEISMGTYPGREYTCKKSGLELKGTIYLVNGRLYQMIVAYPPNQTASLAKDRDAFLKSFKLQPPGGVTPKPNDALYDCASQ